MWRVAIASLMLGGCAYNWGGTMAPADATAYSGRLRVVRVDAEDRHEPERRRDASVAHAGGAYYPTAARLDPDGTRIIARGRTVLWIAPTDRLFVEGSFAVGERTPQGVVVRAPARGWAVALGIAGIVGGGGLLAASLWGTSSYCAEHRCTDPIDGGAALLAVGIGATATLALAASILLVTELVGRRELAPPGR